MHGTKSVWGVEGCTKSVWGVERPDTLQHVARGRQYLVQQRLELVLRLHACIRLQRIAFCHPSSSFPSPQTRSLVWTCPTIRLTVSQCHFWQSPGVERRQGVHPGVRRLKNSFFRAGLSLRLFAMLRSWRWTGLASALALVLCSWQAPRGVRIETGPEIPDPHPGMGGYPGHPFPYPVHPLPYPGQ